MQKPDAVLVGNEDNEQWTLLYWAIWGQMLLLPPPCRICGPFVQPVLIQEEFFGILVTGAVGARSLVSLSLWLGMLLKKYGSPLGLIPMFPERLFPDQTLCEFLCIDPEGGEHCFASRLLNLHGSGS